MTEWGKSGDHERFERLKAQVKAIHTEGPSRLEKDYAYYAEMADNTDLPSKQREQWALLRDEVGRRLGKDAPPSEQTALF